MLEIEKNIPMPEIPVKREFPYQNLEVGDSFFVEGIKNQLMLNRNYLEGKRLGRKFTLRREGNGVRIWRIQ